MSAFEDVLEEIVLVQNNQNGVIRHFKLTRRQAFLLRVSYDVGAWRLKRAKTPAISSGSTSWLTPFGQ